MRCSSQKVCSQPLRDLNNESWVPWGKVRPGEEDAGQSRWHLTGVISET